MLSLRPVRRFRHSTAAFTATASSCDPQTKLNQLRGSNSLDLPALVKLKAERDPEKLFELFQANASNRLVIENLFVFEDTVSRLAGAHRSDYMGNLLEHQNSSSG